MSVSKSVQTNSGLLIFDGKPSWGVAFPQAMQHVLAMLIGNITPPMLIAGICGLSPEEKIMLTQAAMIIGGITTLCSYLSLPLDELRDSTVEQRLLALSQNHSLPSLCFSAASLFPF